MVGGWAWTNHTTTETGSSNINNLGYYYTIDSCNMPMLYVSLRFLRGVMSCLDRSDQRCVCSLLITPFI